MNSERPESPGERGRFPYFGQDAQFANLEDLIKNEEEIPNLPSHPIMMALALIRSQTLREERAGVIEKLKNILEKVPETKKNAIEQIQHTIKQLWLTTVLVPGKSYRILEPAEIVYLSQDKKRKGFVLLPGDVITVNTHQYDASRNSGFTFWTTRSPDLIGVGAGTAGELKFEEIPEDK